MVNQLILSKKSRNILRLSNIVSLFNFKGCINDLNFTGPFWFIACNFNFSSRGKFLIVFLRAGHVVQEITAILVLTVNGSLIFPPGLFCLNISLNHNLRVKLCGNILIVSHNPFGLYIICCRISICFRLRILILCISFRLRSVLVSACFRLCGFCSFVCLFICSGILCRSAFIFCSASHAGKHKHESKQ